MANESSSSSLTLGRIVWQTSMAMSNTATTPAISDSFVSNRWNTSQINQGLIKYTQYVDFGRDSIPAGEGDKTSSAKAITAYTMELKDVEKVDFGWLLEPKFVCFSNCIPENSAGCSVFLGVDSRALRKSMLSQTSLELTDEEIDLLPRPLWMFGEILKELEDGGVINPSSWTTLWGDYVAAHPEYEALANLEMDDAYQFATWNYCQEVFEVPAGVTIGPMIIPPGTTYWAYMEKVDNTTGEISDGNGGWKSAPYGAILITEAYDA